MKPTIMEDPNNYQSDNFDFNVLLGKYGWDVHAWTPVIKNILEVHPHIKTHLNRFAWDFQTVVDILEDIDDYYKDKHISNVILKLKSRMNVIIEDGKPDRLAFIEPDIEVDCVNLICDIWALGLEIGRIDSDKELTWAEAKRLEEMGLSEQEIINVMNIRPPVLSSIDDQKILFGESLREIENHCPQGDSHRLFFYWVSLFQLK